MPTARSMAAAIAGLLPLLAMAQAHPPRPAPTEPAAPIANQPYESVFRHYQPIGEPEQAPAAQWRAANDEMARLRGHAGHLKEAVSSTSDASQPTGSHPGHGGK